MSAFDIYIFVLSLLIIILLASLSIAVVVIIMKLSCKLINSGAEDDKILAEANKTISKSEKIGKIIDQVVSLIFTVLFLVAFVLSTMVSCTKEISMGQIPVFRVVNSDSMSAKHKNNKYLIENDLNDQFDTFDLIITYDIPKEEDLKLYDIVVYKYNDILVVHRIVKIVHTKDNGTYYMLQGDNEPKQDVMPVYYDQMIAIYRGEHVPFIGSFIKFMQSPAGWICIVLVLVAMFAGPALDKKLAKERAKRLAILQNASNLTVTSEPSIEESDNKVFKNENAPPPKADVVFSAPDACEQIKLEEVDVEKVLTNDNEQISMTQDCGNIEEIENVKFIFPNRKDFRSFKQKLDDSSDIVKNRFNTVLQTIERIEKARVIESKSQRTYKRGNTPIVRFAFRGKTLNAFIGLNPNDYTDTKYIFTDVSSVKKFASYPMRVKLSSDRQARWTTELILDLANKNGFTLLEKPVTIIKKEFSFADLKKKKAKTFAYKLRKSPLAKQRYKYIKSALLEIDGVRVIEGKFSETYKLKAIPLVKLAMRGKTLNAYVGLNPNDYQDSKYVYTDVSNVKKYKNYGMRLRLTSNRQVKWLLELVCVIKGKVLNENKVSC